MSQLNCDTEKQFPADLCPVLLIVCHCKNPSRSAVFCVSLFHMMFASSWIPYLLDEAKGRTSSDLSCSHIHGEKLAASSRREFLPAFGNIRLSLSVSLFGHQFGSFSLLGFRLSQIL